MTAERGGALLVNVDSVIPNLALMHISSWRKSEGIPASFSMEDPSEVWASVILRKHRHRTDGLRYLYPDAMIDIGGTGYDLHKRLPDGVGFDSWSYADDCERTIRLLKDAGISPRSTVWQVYCSGEDDVEDCAERCMWLKRHGACSYPMIDGDIPVQTRRMKALRHWARMECYWSVDWEEYKRTNGLR